MLGTSELEGYRNRGEWKIRAQRGWNRKEAVANEGIKVIGIDFREQTWSSFIEQVFAHSVPGSVSGPGNTMMNSPQPLFTVTVKWNRKEETGHSIVGY